MYNVMNTPCKRVFVVTRRFVPQQHVPRIVTSGDDSRVKAEPVSRCPSPASHLQMF